MADDLSVLFRIRGDASGAKRATTEARQAVQQLRASSAADFRQIQSASTQSLGAITQSLSQITSRIPILGSAVGTAANQFSNLKAAAESSAASMGLLAGAGIAAVSVLAGAAKAIFDITSAAAEFQGKMLDLSQQTGVAVETLSTLEIVAKTTGGNIESITASLGIFQKKLEDAVDPTSKEAALLKSLGIETNNTEEAFRQALSALARMPQGFQQTALALELFGRGGKQILAILKEMDGDLDGTTDKFREMGILISTEAAQAADKFNDQLALLGFQIRAVTGIIGNEAMPEILRALTAVSDAFKNNQDTITSWTRDTADAARGAIVLGNAIAFIGSQITGLSNVPTPVILSLLGSISGATGILQGLRQLGTPEIGPVGIPDVTTAPKIGLPVIPSIDTSKKKSGRSGANQEQARAAKEIALTLQALEEDIRVRRAALERERDQDLKNIDEWETESINILGRHLAGQQKIFEEEKANVERFVKDRRDKLLALREIEQKDAKAQNDFTLGLANVQAEAQRKRDQAQLRLEQQLFKIRQAEREGELNRIKDALDRQATTESEAITKRLAIEKQAHEEEKILREIELNAISTSAARKQEIENEAIESEQKFTDRVKELIEERIRAREREANRPGAAGIPEQSADELAKLAGAAADREAGPPPALKEHFDAVKLLSGAYEDLFANIGRGVGEVVQNLVLFGNAGPQAFRKVAASALASVAATAAAQAIYELALGFAALTPWGAALYGPAPLHFKAAALLGSIALVAGVAGRAVAGNAFSGGGGAAGGGGLGSPGQLNPLTLGRNQPQPQRIILQIQSNDSHIVKVIQGDYRSGGTLRELILEDGGV